MPACTVLMTVYNGMPYLPMAVQSILNQTHADFEFIIVNDASTDGSRDYLVSLQDPRIRILDNQRNMNQTWSLNRGLEQARTEFIIRMDADDISIPDRIEKMLDLLKCHPDTAVTGSFYKLIDETGRVYGAVRRHVTPLGICWSHLFGCEVGSGLAGMRKSIVFDKLGGFDAQFHYVQDWELWSRVHAAGYEIRNIPEYLLEVRRHPLASGVYRLSQMKEEDARIRPLARGRILGAPNGSAWKSNLEECIRRRYEHPDYRAGIYRTLFKRFCEIYPEAGESVEVRLRISNQYMSEVLGHTSWPTLSCALTVLAAAWPYHHFPTYFKRLAKWIWMLASHPFKSPS